MENIHSIDVQREMSYDAGREIGLIEAAVSILDAERLDLHVRFHAASIVSRRLFSPKTGANGFQIAIEPMPGPDEFQVEVSQAEVTGLREWLLLHFNECNAAFRDHFTAG